MIYTWDDNEYAWKSRTIQRPPTEEEKGKEKESTKAYPKEAEEHSLAENKHKILKCGQKRTFA